MSDEKTLKPLSPYQAKRRAQLIRGIERRQRWEENRKNKKNAESREANAKSLQNQASRVIGKFGGATNMARMCKEAGFPIHVTTIARWKLAVAVGGTGGYIPIKKWDVVIYVGRLNGIVFSSEDLDPRPQIVRGYTPFGRRRTHST